MKIEYFNKPFHHTIIYDYFDDNEIISIKNEINQIKDGMLKNNYDEQDRHHDELFKKFNVDSYHIDKMFENNRNGSVLLKAITKVYYLHNMGFFNKHKNSFLNFIPDSNQDITMLHGYRNSSSYPKHIDKAVLSFVYPFWNEPKDFTGGDLMFGDYKPPLKSNCCLIFPSYEPHWVTKIKSKKSDIVRWTLNQRIFIKKDL